jgi:hypothetical protein
MWIEHGLGDPVGLRMVHRHENRTRGDGRRELDASVHGATSGLDEHVVACYDGSAAGVFMVHLEAGSGFAEPDQQR